jgi:hypothetical protein
VVEQHTRILNPYPLVYFLMGRRGLVINFHLTARESVPNRTTCPSYFVTSRSDLVT